MNDLYCPYTNKYIETASASYEHVVPKALGGVGSFGLPVDQAANAQLGTEIDGKMAADFLVAQRRNELDARGHSRKRPVPRYRGRLEPEGLPIQLELDKRQRKLEVFSPQHGRCLNGDETAGKRLTFKTQLEPVLWIRFAAKVALAAGYLAYGPQFVGSVQHDELRQFMWTPPNEPKETTFAAGHVLTEPESHKERQLRALTEVFGSAVVVLVPSATTLTVAVGCLGKFVSLVSLNADTTNFPNKESYAWGHIFAVRKGRLTRGSVVDALRIVRSHVAAQ